MDCIFCKIARKEIPSEIVLEDENFLVFKEIRPAAPVHLLVISKNHIGPVNTLNNEDGAAIGRMVLKAKEAAEKVGISESGYRLIFNVGKDSGMEVDHIHLHILGGKPLRFEF